MSQVTPYYVTKLSTKISLQPAQIDKNIDSHILSNLKKKVEGKINEFGIVIRVNRLIGYKNGIIDVSNFMGITTIPVEYECFICSPLNKMEIVCQIEQIIIGFVIVKNGPIILALETNIIDGRKFEVIGDKITHIDTKKVLQTGSHVKVSIINIKKNLDSNIIRGVCRLIDIATADEIKEFERDQLLITGGSYNDENIFI